MKRRTLQTLPSTHHNSRHSTGFICHYSYLFWLLILGLLISFYVFIFSNPVLLSSYSHILENINHRFSTKLIAKDSYENKIRNDNEIMPIKSSTSTVTTPQPTLNRVKTNEPIITQPDRTSINHPETIHFIHIPKCGGTSMTAILRQIQCATNPLENADCCLNPGFCDWHAFRRCKSIKGCTDHFPQIKYIYKPMPSIALFRDPVSRILSAWFYRGHSPNLDFFQVRPWFKEISEGKRPRVLFPEYIEMIEYQNIQTRMLGADSFPYRNITITDEVFRKAVDVLDHLYFVGIQEEFDISVQALLREMHVNITVSIQKERDQNNKKNQLQKQEIKDNKPLMQRLRDINDFDLQLYELAVSKFCTIIKKYPDLWDHLQSNGKVKC